MAINWTNQRFRLSGQRKINPLFVNISSITPRGKIEIWNVAFIEKCWLQKFYLHNIATTQYPKGKNLTKKPTRWRKINPLFVNVSSIKPRGKIEIWNVAFCWKMSVPKLILVKKVWADKDKTALCQYFKNTPEPEIEFFHIAFNILYCIFYIAFKHKLLWKFSFLGLATDVGKIEIYSEMLCYMKADQVQSKHLNI